MACVYRFISNCRKKISGLPIEALKATDHQKSILLLVQKRHVVPTSVRIPLQQEEYLKAERSLLRMAQVGEYIDEVKILLRNRDRPVMHLEVAHGLTTQAYLMAIRRFSCRRGPPAEFFSDNGTNLRGASREIVETIRSIDEDCAEENTTARTKWTFNPPASPHMGGVWERLVRTVKEALVAFDDGRRLTDEVLQTAIVEAEDMINSRPLTYVSQESLEAEALTPNHFLRGVSPNEPIAVPPTPHPAEALRDAYKRSQQLANEMWKRWVKEYVPTVNRRTKWFSESRPLKTGDLVYVTEGTSRKCWIRGVVEEPIVSGDGRIRQAWVRTRTGRFKRATARLAVLEIVGKSEPDMNPEPGLRVGENVGPTVSLPREYADPLTSHRDEHQ
ncbi:uncharacterized protein LOC131679625 [Topomyia yanbarensis]|uniref:uncharacterized protein LOC131679625 n=1 Tax=Topomyia yanbarensis TaxID=2498891 RepID=UPI00273B4603|nr:uncharacterized protein LOC131679625 [Topomyia yanbarensis]